MKNSGSMRGLKPFTAMLLGTAAVLAQPAMAQDAAVEDGTKLEEIVVTAERRSESLMTVPVAVSALTTNDLARQGITSSFDLSASVPSLQVTSAFGEAQPNFTMRGIGVGNEYGANQVSPVGIYTDDNYLSARTMHGLQLFDLDRIEAVRGPQGTLYGRNTTGGAINFISVKPNLEAGARGFVEVGYGRFNEIRAQGAIEGTLSDEYARLSRLRQLCSRQWLCEEHFPGPAGCEFEGFHRRSPDHPGQAQRQAGRDAEVHGQQGQADPGRRFPSQRWHRHLELFALQ